MARRPRVETRPGSDSPPAGQADPPPGVQAARFRRPGQGPRPRGARGAGGGPDAAVRGEGRALGLEGGTAPVGRFYRGRAGSTAASAFEARYEFGRMTAVLEANLSKGLLIVACLKTFRDGSGRSDYFVRE